MKAIPATVHTPSTITVETECYTVPLENNKHCGRTPEETIFQRHDILPAARPELCVFELYAGRIKVVLTMPFPLLPPIATVKAGEFRAGEKPDRA